MPLILLDAILLSGLTAVPGRLAAQVWVSNIESLSLRSNISKRQRGLCFIISLNDSVSHAFGVDGRLVAFDCAQYHVGMANSSQQLGYDGKGNEAHRAAIIQGASSGGRRGCSQTSQTYGKGGCRHRDWI